MRLKHIELLGFKSFAKKSRLDFKVPVVGIVGPNGSGKSNVVEAFRFVLGEQSMKSLRGKSGSDLIFKGSKDLAKSNRASVEIVFDNKDKVFRLSDRSEPINLDFDEIILKREVFTDGTSNYFINDSNVRLRDIVELLGSVNIGASGHHIVSQGEADRILSASAKDRRLMIEDALGLKVYQYKLKDAGRKLEKTGENMKEVGSLRRELAPHIKYLKKAVEKVERGVELRQELSELYLSYFKEEDAFLRGEEATLKENSGTLEKGLLEVSVKLKAHKEEGNNNFENQKGEEIAKLQKEIESLSRTKDELSRKLGRIEGVIEYEKRGIGGPESISIKTAEFENFIENFESSLEKTLADENLESIREQILAVKKLIQDFKDKFGGKTSKNEPVAFKDLEKTRTDVLAQLESIDQAKNKLSESVNRIQKEIEGKRQNAFKDQEERFALETRRNKLESDMEILKARTETFRLRKSSFEEETKEAVALVGAGILNFRSTSLDETRDRPLTAGNNSGNTGSKKKEIERIKIKLEEIGAGSGADVMKEYNEITERDNFLNKELEDLSKSIANLKNLINDLKETLDREFSEGLEKINERFEEFFKLMFGGGNASLKAVVQERRKSLSEEEESPSTALGTDDESHLEPGIEINVTLPQKKVKDLHMLSGGERSLTSIALVFAITQVNPPPFLVLDETDAALDEANSRRYGDMVEKLSKYSQLITVTHNRETMSRADVIYGVTIGADGSSKLLSIRFSEAENYAK